jgi:hypothetical protein
VRDRIIIIAGLLFIAACAIFTVSKIESTYAPAGYLAPSPAPLVPGASATASAAMSAAAPASTAAWPRRTVTTWVTVTPPPSAEDGQ